MILKLLVNSQTRMEQFTEYAPLRRGLWKAKMIGTPDEEAQKSH